MSKPPANEAEERTVVEVDLLEDYAGKKLAISNRLVEANFRLDLTQIRLIWLFATLINNEADEDLKLYRVPIKQAIRFLGIEGNTSAHAQLRKAAAGLVASSVSIPTSEKAFESGAVKKRRSSDWLIASWAASVEYKGSEGFIEFEFSVKLKPYLQRLTKHFTLSELENLMGLRSVYSSRLYLILKRYSYNQNVIKLELRVLRLMLGIDLVGEERKSAAYKNFNDFKRYVLDAAKREVAEKTDMRFEYTPEKTGRKVTHIEFVITLQSRPSERLFSKVSESDEPPIVREVLAAYPPGDFNPKMAARVAEKRWGFVEWVSPKMQGKEELESMRTEGYQFEQYIREKIQLAKMGSKGAGFLTNAIKYNWTSTKLREEKKKAEVRTEHKKRAVKEQAAQDTAEQSRIEEQKKSAEYDRRFSEMPSFAQEEIRRRATEMFRKNASDFERGRYEKEKTDGKTIDDMSVIVAVTYRKYRNQLMDSPEFAERDSEVSA